MKTKFINERPCLIPENGQEEEMLFNWYEKSKGKVVESVLSLELATSPLNNNYENQDYVREKINGFLDWRFSTILEQGLSNKELVERYIKEVFC